MDLFGNTKTQQSIDFLRAFEPPQGYYLAFSGGKDSQCIYHLAKMAEVKFDAHYNLTTVDPPELVWFIKRNYPDVIIHRPDLTMSQLIIKNGMPPTRMVRYCCAALKELGGQGRIVVTGVRWAESVRRKKNRSLFESDIGKKQRVGYNQDNDVLRKQLEVCPTKGKHILNPIINWTDAEVWSFLNSNNIDHCILYDEGYKRIGCVGCPMSSKAKQELERFPKIKAMYIKSFQKMYDRLKEKGLNIHKNWFDGQSIYDFWVSRSATKRETNELF